MNRFVFIVPMIFFIQSAWSQIDNDTIILGLQYKKYYNHEIGVLSNDCKRAFPNKFKNSKSEFDDREIIKSLDDTMKAEKAKVLSQHYLQKYPFQLEPYDFDKQAFQGIHVSKFRNDSLVYFSGGSGESFYIKKYAKFVKQSLLSSPGLRQDVLLQTIKVSNPDSAKRIAEIRKQFADFPAMIPFFLEFMFSSNTYISFGRTYYLLIPKRVILLDSLNQEVVSVPFSQ